MSITEYKIIHYGAIGPRFMSRYIELILTY